MIDLMIVLAFWAFCFLLHYWAHRSQETAEFFNQHTFLASIYLYPQRGKALEKAWICGLSFMSVVPFTWDSIHLDTRFPGWLVALPFWIALVICVSIVRRNNAFKTSC